MSSEYATVSVHETECSVGDVDRMAAAISLMAKVLDGLSSKDRLRAIRAAAGLYGHRVMPGNGTWGTPAPRSVQVPNVGGRPKVPAQPRSSKSAKQKKIVAEIREVNSQIKEKSVALGERLPMADPLLERRSHLFRALHGRENGEPTPHSGEGDPHS